MEISHFIFCINEYRNQLEHIYLFFHEKKKLESKTKGISKELTKKKKDVEERMDTLENVYSGYPW